MTKRFDSLYWEDTTKFTKTPEGYLQGRAVLTNVGVFPYLQKDGSVRWELRPEEEVFKASCMDSLKGKTVTNDHPTELVTSKNDREVSVGSLGETITRDNFHLIGFLTIKDEAAVAAIESNEKRGLSCGYEVEVTTEPMTYEKIDWDGKLVTKTYKCPGVWMGVPYDAIQTNIVNNHVALVKQGRAGDDATIRMDGLRLDLPVPAPVSTPKGKKPMKKLSLDNGLEYEVAPEVGVAYESLKLKCDSLASEVTATKAAMDSKSNELRAALDAKDEEIKGLKATVEGEAKRVDAAVAGRLVLLTTAQKAGVTLKGDESEVDVKKAVILAVSPEAKLDGESDEYVGFRFKLACESLDTTDKNRQDTGDVPGSVAPRTPELKVDAREEARAAMIASYTKSEA